MTLMLKKAGCGCGWFGWTRTKKDEMGPESRVMEGFDKCAKEVGWKKE